MPLLYTDARFLLHETGPHPESAARLRSVQRYLESSGLGAQFAAGSVAAATVEQLSRVHTGEYIAAIERFAARGGGHLEADTVVSSASSEVARLAAGAAIDAVEQVLDERHRHAVCLSRPPGHHARPEDAMGFCLFNNVAVAAAHARAAFDLNRVLIVDWDVHHGNGTQEMFYSEEHVYFLSVHRYPFYPGTGDEDEFGSGAGLGTIYNLPLAYGTSRREFRERFASQLQTAADRCRPELVLISAGFDAHAADPIGSLGLESEDFADLTHLVLEVADQYCAGKVVSLLEGGYHVDALAESVAAHLETILGWRNFGH